MKQSKNYLWVLIAIQVVIIVCTVWSVGAMVLWRGEGNMAIGGARAFRYFTVDSNILAAIASAVLLPQLVKAAKAGNPQLSRGASMLYHAGATSVAITFFTVLFFLGPTMGYAAMFVGNNFFMHGSTPVLAMVSSIILLARITPRLTFKQSLAGWIPVVIYGAVYISCVVFTQFWPDFYGFNRGGMWFISYPVMMLAGFGLSCGLWALQNKVRKRIL